MKKLVSILFIIGTVSFLSGLLSMTVVSQEITKEEELIEKINKLERENTQLKRDVHYLRREYESNN